MGTSEWKRTTGNWEQRQKRRHGGPGGKQETERDWGKKKRETEGDGKNVPEMGGKLAEGGKGGV